MCGLDKSVTKQGVALLGHTGAAGVEVAGLNHSRIKLRIGRELIRRRKPLDVSDGGKDHCPVEIPDAGDCHNRRVYRL